MRDPIENLAGKSLDSLEPDTGVTRFLRCYGISHRITPPIDRFSGVLATSTDAGLPGYEELTCVVNMP